MTSTMLAAVRDSVVGSVELSLSRDENSQTGGLSMSENEGAPAAKTTGISQAEHDAAVAAARAEGHAAGIAEANERMGEILGAEGIKGDGGKMAAAFELATKSPAMGASDVTAFVTANVASASSDAAAYETQRLSAVGLAQPHASKKSAGSLNGAEIYARRRAQRES